MAKGPKKQLDAAARRVHVWLNGAEIAIIEEYARRYMVTESQAVRALLRLAGERLETKEVGE